MSEAVFQKGCRLSKARRAFCRTKKIDARGMTHKVAMEDSPTLPLASQIAPRSTQHIRREEHREWLALSLRTTMGLARTTLFLRISAVRCSVSVGYLRRAHWPTVSSIPKSISSRQLSIPGRLLLHLGARPPTQTSSR